MITGIVASWPTSVRDSDGPTNWNPVPPANIPVLTGFSFNTIATNGTGTWIAAGRQGSSGQIVRSFDDTSNWSAINDPNTSTGTNLIRWVNDAFYGFTYNRPTAVLRSVDGVSWASYATSTGVNGYVWEVRVDPNNTNRIWLVCSDGLRLSSNGMAGPWSNVTGAIFNFTPKDLITDGAGNWLCVGGSSNDQAPGRYMTSTNNGLAWSAVTTLDSGSGARFDCTARSATHWVIGSNNRIWYSTDMTTWASVPVTGLIASLAYNPADGSFVGAQGSQTPVVSRDSITTWKSVAVPGQTYTYTDIAYSSDKWVIVGTSIVIANVAKG